MKKILFVLLFSLSLIQVDAQTLINEGFESSAFPTGWAKSSATGNPWTGPYNMATYAHGGTYSMYCARPTSGSANDSWLYSTGALLTAGTQYYTEFYTRTFSSSDYQALYLYIGEGQTPAAQTNLLVNLLIYATPTYTKESTVFTVPATGTYNLGFHDQSPAAAAAGDVFVDDVLLRVAIPGNAAPINFISTVANTNVTLQWTDNSTNETAFRVFRSTDSITYTQVGADIPSTTTAGTGTVYSQTETALADYTKYYYRIVSVADIASLTYLQGTATTTFGSNVVVFSGLWSSNLTWSLGTPPTIHDSVTIPSGMSVYVDIPNALCYKLFDSGILSYDASGVSRELYIDSDLIIASTGQYLAAVTNPSTSTTEILSVSGNLINRGTIACHNMSNAYAEIAFIKANNAYFTTSAGSSTDLHLLSMNKGTDRTSSMTFIPSVPFTSDLTSSNGFLYISSGTFNLSGTVTQTSNLFSSSTYSIPYDAGFWMNDPNFTVSAQNGNHTFDGLFRLTAGTFNIGTVAANLTFTDTGAKLIVEGGTMNIGGSLTLGNNGGSYDDTLIQTGGAINFTTGASANETLEITGGCYHAMSGGTMTFVQPCTSPSFDIDFNNLHATCNITGGTVNMGNAGSATGSTFFVIGSMNNLYIDSAVHPKICRLYYSSALIHTLDVYGKLYVPATATLDVNDGYLVFHGDTLTNNGSIVGPYNSYLKLYGINQVIAGSGNLGTIAAPFGSDGTGFGIADTSLTLACTNHIVLYRVNLFSGWVHNAYKFKIGVGDASLEVVQFGTTSLGLQVGGFDSAPDYSTLSPSGFVLYYISMPHPFTTSYEIPPLRTVINFGVYYTDSVKLSGGNLNVSANLTMVDAIFNTDTNDVLVLQNTAQYPPTPGDSATYVNGPLAMQLATTNDTTRTFFVGKAGVYRPVTLNYFQFGRNTTNIYCGSTEWQLNAGTGSGL